MTDPLLLIGAILALAVLYGMLPVFLDVLMRYRKSRMVNCPRKNEEASVNIDAKEAAFTALVGKPKVQVKTCSLWRDDMLCNQECLSQL